MLTHLLLNIDGSVELYPIFSSMIEILTFNCVKKWGKPKHLKIIYDLSTSGYFQTQTPLGVSEV